MRTSPNFAPLRADENQPQLLTGLLSSNPEATRMTKVFGKMAPRRPFVDDPPEASLTSEAPLTPAPVGQLPPIATPPGVGAMNKTAKVQYARSTPPAASPSNVWQQGMPNNKSIADALLDNQVPPVPNFPPAMPPAPMDDPRQTPSLPPEAELIMGSDSPPQLAPVQYLNPIMYQPLQPSRRYEVL